MRIEERLAAVTAHFNLTPLAEGREAFHVVRPRSSALPCFGFAGLSPINNNKVIPHYLPGVCISQLPLPNNQSQISVVRNNKHLFCSYVCGLAGGSANFEQFGWTRTGTDGRLWAEDQGTGLFRTVSCASHLPWMLASRHSPDI